MPATVTPKPTPVAAQLPEVTAYVGATRLTGAKNIEYEEVAGDVGSFSFTLQGSDSQRSLLATGTLVLLREFGTPKFPGVIEDISTRTVVAGEEAGQVTTYSGRSTLGELERAIVYPARDIEAFPSGSLAGLRLASKPFPDVRYWNYANLPSYSGWSTAANMFLSSQSPAQWPPAGYIGAPSPWPYPSSYWIAPRAISGGAHPVGDWYATAEFETSGFLSYDMFFAVGPVDSALVWVDGVPILKIDAKDALKPKRVNVAFNDGTHRIVVKVSHGGAAASGDITGLNCVVFPHLDYGQGLLETPAIFTDASEGWVCRDFGLSLPGWNLTEIANSLIDEPQARTDTGLDGWTKGWGVEETSELEPTPEIPEFSAPIGTKVLNAFRMLEENYIEIGVNPAASFGRQLSMSLIPGVDDGNGDPAVGKGTDTGVELEPGVNLLELTHRTTPAEATVMLTRWDGGYLELPTAEADGRLEAYLSTPDTTDGIQTFYNSARQVSNLATESESIEDVRHRLTEDTDYDVGDYVTIPDRAGTPTLWRCVARAVDTDDDGNGFVTSSFGVPRDDAEARNERWLRKNDGTLDGRAEIATTGASFLIDSENLSPVKLNFSTGGSGVTIVGDRGTPERPDEPLLVVAFDLEADIAGASGSTVVALEVNGTGVQSATLPSGDTFVRQILATPVLVTVTDWLNVETTAAGGAQGLSATALCMAAT
jgi:hypothetical protein